MRVREAELDQLPALVDRRCGHRRRAGEVAQLDRDARIGDELLCDRHGLARVAAAVLEVDRERTAVNAAAAVDLVEREVEAALPLFAVLRILPRQRPAHADHHRLARHAAAASAARRQTPCGSERRHRAQHAPPCAACVVLKRSCVPSFSQSKRVRACNHPVQDDPTKFCAYRYRAPREAGEARERPSAPSHRAMYPHAAHHLDSIGVSFEAPITTHAQARNTGHRNDQAFAVFALSIAKSL